MGVGFEPWEATACDGDSWKFGYQLGGAVSECTSGQAFPSRAFQKGNSDPRKMLWQEHKVIDVFNG